MDYFLSERRIFIKSCNERNQPETWLIIAHRALAVVILLALMLNLDVLIPALLGIPALPSL